MTIKPHAMISAAILGLSLSLMGCSTLPKLAADDTSLLASTIKDEQAFYIAVSAYKGVLITINEAIDAGLIIPASDKALKINDLRKKADVAMELALQAKKVGDATTVAARSVELMALVVNINEELN